MNIDVYKLPDKTKLLDFLHSIILNISSKKLNLDTIESDHINILATHRKQLFDNFVKKVSPVYFNDTKTWLVDMNTEIAKYKISREKLKYAISNTSNEDKKVELSEKLNSMSLENFIDENKLDLNCPWKEIYLFYEKKRKKVADIWSWNQISTFEDFFCLEDPETIEERRRFYHFIFELNNNENLSKYINFLFNEYFLEDFIKI